jgi:HAD superfamily hydrolase (TIGR01509 family)
MDKEQRFRRRARGLKPIPGLHELLNWAVSQRGKLAVVTNAPRANAEHILQDLGIASSFECLIAVEDVVHPKPAPEPYLLAVSRLGLMRDNCVAFEDSPSGVKSAVAAGLVVVGLLTGHSEQELRDAGARLIVDDFSSPLVREMLVGVPR